MCTRSIQDLKRSGCLAVNNPMREVLCAPCSSSSSSPLPHPRHPLPAGAPANMWGVVAYRYASFGSLHMRVLIFLPLRVVCWPAMPTHRSCRMGWSMMPTTGTPLCSSEIRVPNRGLPGGAVLRCPGRGSGKAGQGHDRRIGVPNRGLPVEVQCWASGKMDVREGGQRNQAGGMTGTSGYRAGACLLGQCWLSVS